MTSSPAPPTRHLLGIDVGGTKILGRLVDSDAPLDVVAEHRVDTPRGSHKIVDAIETVIAALVDEVAGSPVDTVGIGIAGLVDTAGVLRYAPNLPTVVDLDLPSELAERLGLVARVDNDANCAARAEHAAGIGRGVESMVLVTLGTGIGGGVVINGEVERGAFGFAGEPGHMLVDPQGPPCPCGRRGCWERFGSGSGLGRMARDAAAAGRADRLVEMAGGAAEAVRGEHVTEAAASGDAGALAILDGFAWWVAVGIANLVNLLDPEMVVIGGGLAEAGALLLDPVRAAYTDLVVAPDHRRPVRIEMAALGSDAGAIGATLLAAT